MQIDLTEKEWQINKSVLSQYPFAFYAFGSRVKKTAKKYSDLDLCYKENIPDSVVAKIEEDFIESDLPFKVDIVNWKNCSADFQKLIAENIIPLKF